MYTSSWWIVENRLFPSALFPEKGNVLMKGLVYRWNMTLVSEQTAIVPSCQEENSKICVSKTHSAPQDCSCIRAVYDWYTYANFHVLCRCRVILGWILDPQTKISAKITNICTEPNTNSFFCPTKRSHLPPCDLYAWIRLRFQFALARIFGWNPGMGNDDIVQNQSVTTGSCTNLKLIVTRDRYSKRTISKS